MTRETKIGLLVGLCFIIIVGILLSDQWQHTNDVPSANLTTAGNNVRQGNGLPNSVSPAVRATIPDPKPSDPVPTHEEVSRSTGFQRVEIGAAHPERTTPVPPPATADGGAPAGDQQATTAAPGTSAADPDTRIRAGHDSGEEIVRVGGNNSYEADHSGGGSTGQTSPAHRGDGKQVQAAPGDTLSRLAAKYMGANTKANRDAIVKANPSLAADPNKIISGRTYVIPTAPPPQTTSSVQSPGPVEHPAPAAAPPAPTPDAGPTIYVVQPGDSLYRIARDQLGDPNACQAIRELNKDVLNGSDTLQPDMKLRLPSKPIASNR